LTSQGEEKVPKVSNFSSLITLRGRFPPSGCEGETHESALTGHELDESLRDSYQSCWKLALMSSFLDEVAKLISRRESFPISINLARRAAIPS
jgi:hypothetical protein